MKREAKEAVSAMQCWLEDGGRGPRAKECRWPLEVKKGKEMLPTESPQKRMQLCQHPDETKI